MKTNQTVDGLCERSKFLSHLEAASDTIRSWPAWKKDVIGPILPEQRIRNESSIQESKK